MARMPLSSARCTLVWLAAASVAKALAGGDSIAQEKGQQRPQPSVPSARSFTIKEDRFVKDGAPITLRSGSLHYARVPPAYWKDRIERLRALGLNAVTTYVPWNYHEAEEGRFDAESDSRNVVGFLREVQEAGMLAIVRPGPYICAEWEMGGLPAWLLARPGIRLRTYEEQYIDAVEKYWGMLLPLLRPLLYSEGGPVVMVQIENEFGYYGDCQTNPDDARYMRHLLSLAERHLGVGAVIFSTVDGAFGGHWHRLAKGSPFKSDARVLATVDGATSHHYSDSFEAQKRFNAPGRSPKMWVELWVGWYSWWGGAATNKSAHEIHAGVRAMVGTGASFSLYMAHGGTNFGPWAGAQSDPHGLSLFQPITTSYDYCAPISEAGDHGVGSDGGDLFEAVRSAIAEVYGKSPAEPEPVPKVAYGWVGLPEAASLLDNVDALSSCEREVKEGEELPALEDLGHYYGMALYRRRAPAKSAAASKSAPLELALDAKRVHDRAQVLLDGREVGIAYRAQASRTLALPADARRRPLDLLVEIMGRVNFGLGLADRKGLIGDPPLDGDWTLHCIPLRAKEVRSLPFTRSEARTSYDGPTFFRGLLRIDGEVHDTFLDTDGLAKGYIWVNGHALGRYWETLGPQHTLYLPAPFLRKGDNEVVVLELHPRGLLRGSSLALESVARPRWAHHSKGGLLFV